MSRYISVAHVCEIHGISIYSVYNIQTAWCQVLPSFVKFCQVYHAFARTHTSVYFKPILLLHVYTTILHYKLYTTLRIFQPCSMQPNTCKQPAIDHGHQARRRALRRELTALISPPLPSSAAYIATLESHATGHNGKDGAAGGNKNARPHAHAAAQPTAYYAAGLAWLRICWPRVATSVTRNAGPPAGTAAQGQRTLAV